MRIERNWSAARPLGRFIEEYLLWSEICSAL
jgi:hypothetical protein